MYHDPSPVYRSHLGSKDPWFFSSAPETPDDEPGGRWELPTPAGTCHVGDTVAAALWERFGPELHEFGNVSEQHFERIEVTEAVLRPDLRIADLTGQNAPRHGVTTELFSTADYTLTRLWAEVVREAGWDALRAISRFEIGSRVIALFGEHQLDHRCILSDRRLGNAKPLAAGVGLVDGDFSVPPTDAMTFETPDPS